MSTRPQPPPAGQLGIALGPGRQYLVHRVGGEQDRRGSTRPPGTISEFATPTPASYPVGIAAGANDTLWFAESGASKVGEINLVSHAITEFATPTPSSEPFGISAGPDGNVWFTEKAVSKIGVISPSTGAITELPTPTAAGQPNEISQGPDGSLWFTEPATGKIGELDPTTHAITEVALGASTDPLVIAPGADGNLWFTEGGSANQIGQLNPVTRVVETFVPPSAAGNPTGIAAGADGNLWFTEPAVGRIAVNGAGAPAPSVTPPLVSGPAQPGSQLVCSGETWSNWAGLQPSLNAYAFDGYRWLRNGSVIPGANALAYTPVSGDVGTQLACAVTVTYPLLSTTTSAGSSAVTVYPTLVASLTATSVSGTTASLTLACQGLPGLTCSGPLALSSHVTTESKKPVAVAANTKQKPKPPPKVTTVVKVGSGSYSVASGGRITVKLGLGTTGKGLLNQFYRLPTTLSITGTSSIATPVTFSWGRIHVSPSYTWSFAPDGTVDDELTLSKLPSGSKVTVICHGHGCPFGDHAWSAPKDRTLKLSNT